MEALKLLATLYDTIPLQNLTWLEFKGTQLIPAANDAKWKNNKRKAKRDTWETDILKVFLFRFRANVSGTHQAI